MRKEMKQDPFYSTCSLYGQHDHICEGAITWEHTLIYAGNKIQEIWAIIPLCERGHAVNSFQDAGTMKKDMNQWVAFNRGTDNDFAHFPKATPPYAVQKERLNKKYGEYIRKVPPTILKINDPELFVKVDGGIWRGSSQETKKLWYPLNGRDKILVQKTKVYYKETLEINYTDHQIISELIRIGAERLLPHETPLEAVPLNDSGINYP